MRRPVSLICYNVNGIERCHTKGGLRAIFDRFQADYIDMPDVICIQEAKLKIAPPGTFSEVAAANICESYLLLLLLLLW